VKSNSAVQFSDGTLLPHCDSDAILLQVAANRSA